MMLAISSQWLGKDDPASLLEFMSQWRREGIRDYELVCRAGQRPQLHAAHLKKQELRITNLYQQGEQGESPLSPAAVHDSARQQAIQTLVQLARQAQELGVRHLVIWPGRVQVPNLGAKRQQWRQAAHLQDREADQLRRALLAEREQLRVAFLDHLCRSLHTLCRTMPEIIFALPTPRFYDELPALDELEWIFDEVKVPNLGYWHATGWAQVLQEQQLAAAEAWLARYGKHLVGVHLDDGAAGEALLPAGSGAADFHTLRLYLPAKALRIVTLDQRFHATELRMALKFLHDRGF